ncbi:uncharacterized protein LOC100202641 isoform X1 [Hydra vulgaris]|uniref:uncharacterized protein LOC100202641 isoform X1 n=1 Tax=Hydra vulgaris TaxID=6087 RepID=UPI001F5F94CF|nr:uncharacterized protein LOC100202641 [Hydra vulgaris]
MQKRRKTNKWWKLYFLIHYFYQYVQTDTLLFLNDGIARCVLPKNNALFVYPLSAFGDCCKNASFISIGPGIYMEMYSGLCIEVPKNLSLWDGAQVNLGGACTGTFFMTGDSKMKVFSQGFCLSYNTNSEVIFKKCEAANSIMAFEKCGVDPFQTTTSPTTTTKATSPSTVSPTTTTTEMTTTVVPWSEWSQCSILCGFGFKTRSSTLTNCTKDCYQSETASCQVDCAGLQLSNGGESCDQYCKSIGFLCNPVLEYQNWYQMLLDFNITCANTTNLKEKLWKDEWNPSIIEKSSVCVGYLNRSSFVNCSAVSPSGIKRFCKCDVLSDIGFGGWSSWSNCSNPCNIGQKKRFRQCLITSSCFGKSYETEFCNTLPCPIDGGYTEWGPWAINCTKQCGMGFQNRTRTCTNPKPQYGGLPCYDSPNDFIFCNVQMCPIDGSWTEWTAYDDCNKPCNGGNRVRYRFCVEPRPDHGGKQCEGNSTEKIKCNVYKCNEVIVLVNLTLQGRTYSEDLQSSSSKSFLDLQSHLLNSLIELYLHTPYNNTILGLILLPNVRKGLENNSLDVSFEVKYDAIDESQLLILQDAISLMKSISKISVSPKYNATSNNVPNDYPKNLSASSFSYSTINVTWNEMYIEGGFLNYLVFYKVSNQLEYSIRPATSTEKVLIGLQADTWYTIRIAIDTTNGNGLLSPSIETKTLATVPLVAPQFLTNKVTGAFSIFVSWSIVPIELFGGSPVGYNIRYLGRHDVDFTDIYVTFEKRHHTITDLEPYHSYIIYVCAVNKIGRGPCSRTQITTDFATPSLAPEMKLKNKCLNGSIISLEWSDIPEENIYGELTKFQICYQKTKVSEIDYLGTKMCIYLDASVHAKDISAEFSSTYSIQISAANQNGFGVVSEPLSATTCRCPDKVYANYNIMKPYVYRDSKNNLIGAFPAILDTIIRGACGQCCVNGNFIETTLYWTGKNKNVEKNSSNEVGIAINNEALVSFPILAEMYIEDMFGGKFIPIFKHPGSLFMVRVDSFPQQLDKMVQKIFSVWPIIMIFTCMLIPSGILLWLMDLKKDTPTCFQGSCNGVWLAFITAATLGYGDYRASTVVGRIITVIWSFASLVCTSLIIGAIATFLMSSNIAAIATSLMGLKVAAVEGTYEQKLALQNIAQIKTYSNVKDVSKAVENSEMDGLLVDSSVASSYSFLFNKSNMVYYEIIQNKLYYGIIISGPLSNANSYFRKYVSENHKDISSLVEKYAQIFQGTPVSLKAFTLFAADSPLLKDTFWISCTIIGSLIVLGIIANYTFCKLLQKPGYLALYTSKVKDHEELLSLANDFKNHFIEDMNLFDKKHTFERIFFPLQGNRKWKNSVLLRYKRAAFENAYYKTFYGEDIYLKDANLIFINSPGKFRY